MAVGLLILTIAGICILGGLVYVMDLAVRALNKYLARETAKEKAVPKSLSETLKAQRVRCGMTQEFVAESLGVSRQAVSKWEGGASSPSTANLLALAKLYGVSAGDLLREMEE